MIVKEGGIFYLDDTDGKRFHITSAGVLVHTGQLSPGGNAWFLLVEQFDQPNKPWGIPAGRLEMTDQTVAEAACRETLEETGLVIPPQALAKFLFLRDHDKTVKCVYSYGATEKQILSLGEIIYREDKAILLNPRQKKDPTEIGKIALVHRDLINVRTSVHPIFDNQYRADIIYEIVRELNALRIV